MLSLVAIVSFVLGAGFGGGILAAFTTALASLVILALIGQVELAATALEHWPVIVLMAFPEGFINGTVVTAFTILAPEQMKLLDSQFYFPED